MRSRATGMLGAVVFFLGAALAAEAQPIVIPSGPTALHVTDTTSTFTSTVTTNYSFWYYLFIYNNAVEVDGHRWFIMQSGPTYNFSTGPMSTATWNLAVGDQIDYQSNVRISATIGTKVDWNVTVSQSTSMAPGKGGDSAFAEALPERRRGPIENDSESEDVG